MFPKIVRSIKRWSSLLCTSTVFWALSLPPTAAQVGGDAFSAGDAGTQSRSAPITGWQSEIVPGCGCHDESRSYGLEYTVDFPAPPLPKQNPPKPHIGAVQQKEKPKLTDGPDPFLEIPFADSFACVANPSWNEDAFSVANVHAISVSDPFVSDTLAQSDDAFSDALNETVSLSMRALPAQSPLLQGATNGTIGPWLEVSSAGRPSFKSSRSENWYARPVAINFLEPDVTVPKIKLVLRELCAPLSAQIQSAPPAALLTGEPSVSKILKLAEKIENRGFVRTRKYRVVAMDRSKNRRSPVRRVWAQIYVDQTPAPVLAQLYAQAAMREKTPAKSHFYLGKSACYRRDWDEAWRQFAQVYKLAKDDPGIIEDVVALYRQDWDAPWRKPGGGMLVKRGPSWIFEYAGASEVKTSQHDLELCIWLTRFLRVARDWPSFDNAYYERSFIEQKWAEEAVNREKGPNVAWENQNMPLKVYFEGAGTAGYDCRFMEIFRDCEPSWVKGSGCKIDFAETKDAKNADIICRWVEPYDRYEQYQGSSTVPKGTPELADSGTTFVTFKKSAGNGLKMSRALIEIYARQGGTMRTIDETALWNVCLHEVGHALGIVKHLHGQDDVMYAFLREGLSAEKQLTSRDQKTVNALYKDAPVNQSASDKYIGMRAVCKKLELQAFETAAEAEVYPVRQGIHPVRAEIHPARMEIHPVQAEVHPVQAEVHPGIASNSGCNDDIFLRIK